MNIVESATSKIDVDDFCAIVEDGVFAIRRQLPALPARTATTVAKRPVSEKPRTSNRRQRQQNKRAALEGLAPKAMQQRARASRATALQSGQSAETPVFIGSSDKSDDESSEFSTIVAHTYARDSDSQTSRSSMSASSAYEYM